jgi:O-antigen/teichoic acid export membrane protein
MVLFTGLAAVVNIAANFYLMPCYGLMGAALAALLAYVVMTLSIFIANQKIYKVDYEYRRLLILFGYLLTALLLYYLVPLNLHLRILLTLAMPVVLFMLNFFNTEEKVYLRSIFKR